MGVHDGLFKALLEEPGLADALIRERLPAELVAALSEAPAEPVPESFITELKEYTSDRLFRLQLRRGGALYCLLEHKRTQERFTALQLGGYLMQGWARLEKAPDRDRLLPAIMPLVVYNGEVRWSAPRRFAELLDLDAALRSLALDFEFPVFDLGAVEDAELSANPTLKGGLLALKLANEGDPVRLERRVRQVLVHLLTSPREGDSALRAFLVYAHQALDMNAVPLLREVVRELAPDKEREMITAAEHYIAQGFEKGMAQGVEKGMAQGVMKGVEEGRVHGLRAAVTRVLVKRFGPPTAALAASIAAADADTLERWLERAIDAPTPDAVTR